MHLNELLYDRHTGPISMCWTFKVVFNHFTVNRTIPSSYSGEFKLSPSVVRSLPSARWTIPGSVSAARINVSRPIMPNWSVTIPEGMFVTRPTAAQHFLSLLYFWNNLLCHHHKYLSSGLHPNSSHCSSCPALCNAVYLRSFSPLVLFRHFLWLIHSPDSWGFEELVH